jgi:hypothetical protein
MTIVWEPGGTPDTTMGVTPAVLPSTKTGDIPGLDSMESDPVVATVKVTVTVSTGGPKVTARIE